MPRIPIDFSAAQVFDVLPEGQYEATIDEVRYREARAEGKFAQLAVVMTIAEGQYTGRKAFQNLSLSDKAAFRLAKFFATFGFDTGEWDGLDVEDGLLVDPDLAGEPVRIKVKHRMWQGETQADVEVVEAYNVGQRATPEPAAPELMPEPATRQTRQASPARTSGVAQRRVLR